MSDVAIKVDNLAKLYQIGTAKSGSLRESMVAGWQRIMGAKSQSVSEDFWALDDVSFEIKQGEAVGIIGKNGAGKSTLLKILSRITEPTKGRIEINGRVASLLEVGTGFHPELSGRENVYLNGTILGMTRREIKAKFDEIVDFSGVEKFIDTPVKHYSSGMYVRLAFAVAAHLEPEILIIDEVLAVGDSEFQKKCLGKMGEVAGQGRTVLFVSHQMATINALCNRGIMLRQGKVDFQGTAQAATEWYITGLQNMNAEKVWPDLNTAPGNDKVKIVAVRILLNAEVSSNIPIDEEFSIEIAFYNQKAGAYLSPGLQLFNRAEVGVLASVNWPSATESRDDWAEKPYPVGYFKTQCTIPACFLNEGSFYVNAVLLSEVANIAAIASEAVAFDVIDTGAMRKEYQGGWLGVVRPKLNWQTDVIRTNEPILVA